jgi:methionyl-tRNA formyltransferase
MNLVFMGTPDFAVVCLNKLLESGFPVRAVVTIPDRPQGRGQKMLPSPVKKAALAHGIETLQPDLLDDVRFVERLQALNADLFVVVAFRILPEEIFTIPAKGTVNVHASLLPEYRGAAPINRAIINGKKETGVTTMFIEKKVDTGKILMQARITITDEMTAGMLHDALAVKGASLLVETIRALGSGKVTPVQQDDSMATRAPKIRKEECHINFTLSNRDVNNWIRGLSPSPAAFCMHKDKLLRIYRARLNNDPFEPATPGSILKIGKDFFRIACAEGAVDVLDVQLEGKKRMNVREFLLGYTIKSGEQLT